MALFDAIQAGNLDEVSQIITANPTAVNEPADPEILPLIVRQYHPGYGQTPLHIAAFFGQANIIECLLNHGAEIDALEQDGETPLHFAANQGHVDAVQVLLNQGARILTDDQDEDCASGTALHKAAYNGNTAIISLLLDHGANLNYVDLDGHTALLEACVWGHVDAVNLFLERGAILEQTNSDGQTPLMLAAQNGKKAVVQSLLELDVSIQTIDSDGWTALHWAVHENLDPNIIEILINHGADIYQADMLAARTPYEMAEADPDLQADMQAWHDAYQRQLRCAEQLRLYRAALKILWTEYTCAQLGLPAGEISILPPEILLYIVDFLCDSDFKEGKQQVQDEVIQEVSACAALRAHLLAHHHTSLLNMVAGSNAILNRLNQVAMQEAWNLYPADYAIVPFNPPSIFAQSIVSKKAIHPHFTLEFSQAETQSLYPAEKKAKVEVDMSITLADPVRKKPKLSHD